MALIVIADAGPLIAFAAVDALFVLEQLFSNVVITQSVQAEYSSKPGADTRRIDAAITERWLAVKPIEGPSFPLSPSLGTGESDSIRLAMEDPDGSLLIVDDRLARRYALRSRLNIVGTVRLLDLAERRGLIGGAEQVVREMADFGYRISPALLHEMRRDDRARPTDRDPAG